MPDYEVKIVPRFDLNEADRNFINNKINEISNELDMYVHDDGITYSKKPPYKKLEDIPAGVKFYFKLRNFQKKYFALFEYYSYLEGDINGRIIRRSN